MTLRFGLNLPAGPIMGSVSKFMDDLDLTPAAAGGPLREPVDDRSLHLGR